MQAYAYVAIVTLVALLVYIWTLMGVGGARRKTGINAPAMTGDPVLERAVRVQANTLEALPIFLPSLWLAYLFWQPQDPTGIVVSLLGVVWIIGRIIYALAYTRDPATRSTGFLISGLAALVLLLGALGKAIVTLFV